MHAHRARLVLGLIALASAMAVTTTAEAAAQPVLRVCADPSSLPYSNERQQGFENRIASLIAKDLGARVEYTWNLQRRSFLRRTLNAGACDVVMNVPAALSGVLATRPYYTSTYVFVTRRARGLELHSFDDPRLAGMKIGLQALGAEGANTPPGSALGRRGLADNVRGYPVWGEEGEASPAAGIIKAVATGEIDVAIVWGPLAGYFASRQKTALRVTAVEADPQTPALAFQYSMAVGVRRDDSAFRDRLQDVLDRRQPEIDAILAAYGVPRVAAAGASVTEQGEHTP